jgi:glycosyltransferase involved in cell wall biosynthesis
VQLLYTIPDFWPYVRRGSERVVHDLSVQMARSGNDVTIITRTPEGPAATARTEGFQIRYRPARPALSRVLGLRSVEGFAPIAATSVLTRRADLYHTFHMADAYAVSRLRPLLRRPVLFSYHGIPGRRWLKEHEPRLERWFTEALKRIDCVTVMTEFSAERLSEDYHHDPVVLTPGIFVDDYARPREEPEGPTIVCSAAIDDPRKRMDVLLDAFELAAGRRADLRLWLVGCGGQADVLRRIGAMPASIAGRVRIEPVADLPAAYAKSTVGVLTSTHEAFGLVVAEYLASGMPAVVSDDGGSPEILSRGTGLVFPVGEATACAEALLAAIELASDRTTDVACRERARLFDWSVRIGAYEALYRSLAD